MTRTTYEGDSTLVQDLDDLLCTDGTNWRLEYQGADWVLIIEWTTDDHRNPHDAFWVTYTWQFYGDTVDEAVEGAVEWCWALNALDEASASGSPAEVEEP